MKFGLTPDPWRSFKSISSSDPSLMGRGFWRWVTKRFLFKSGAEWKCPVGSYFFLQLLFCSCSFPMHNLDLKINGSKVTKTWGKQACNSNMLPDPELRKFSFINFGAMKGFNFSRFGKVQRQQHQEELAAQQVKYMHQHLGSSRSGSFLSHTKSSKTPSEPFGVLQVFACFCLKMFIYIPSILHMCYDSYHPSKTRTCFFTFCLGGGLFKVKPWTCRGAQITLEELEFWITEKVSLYQQEKPLCEEQDWLQWLGFFLIIFQP